MDQTTDLKVHIFGEAEPIQGYTNISIYPTKNPNVITMDVRMLDKLIYDESADEVVADNIVNKIPPDQSLQVLGHWIKKVKKGGLFKISFLNIREISRLSCTYDMDLNQLHSLIFGHQNDNRSICDIGLMKNALMQFGLSIENISSSGLLAFIEARKV